MCTLNQSSIISGIGKRKTSVAKVFLSNGKNLIWVNKKLVNDNKMKFLILKPLTFIVLKNMLDIHIYIKGGGICSQLAAIHLAISNALIKLNKTYRVVLKKELLLRSDSRIKERKKYGLKKARKAPQYSKR